MTFRTGLVTTATVVLLVTSRLHAAGAPPQTTPVLDVLSAQPACSQRPLHDRVFGKDPSEPIYICADSQEKQGEIYTLRGNVEVDVRNYRLTADEIVFDRTSGDVKATGHVVLEGGAHDEQIEATDALYNVNTETGRFEHVRGSIGLKRTSRHLMLTSSNPFLFTGRLVDKTGPEHYIVHDGTVTVCDQPQPAWSLDAERVVVEVGDNAQIYHSTFRLRGVPLFYLPFAEHPIDNLGRQTGFLIPNFGVSSRKGTTIGDAFYWAINRSSDLTLGAEYFSSRGWAQHGSFRFRPDEESFVEARYFGVVDRGAPGTHQDQGGEEFTLTAEGMLPLDIRAVANIDYLSSFVFRLAFNETFAQAVNSEVKSTAFLSKTQNGFFFNTSAHRYQNFESTAHGDVVTILHAPSFEVASVDRPIGRSRLFWSYEATAEGVSRTEPGFSTNPVVGRFDLTPRIALPILLGGWSLRPEVAVRDTYYTQRVQPNSSIGVPLSADVNRRALETSFELRPPAVGRIFDRQFFGRTLKHVIEPRLAYHYVNGISNFNEIIRFDERDIFSDTNEAEYGVVNRLYAKRHSRAGNCPPPQAAPVAPSSGGRPLSRTNASDRVGTEEPSDQDLQDEAIPLTSACDDAGSVREIASWEIAQKAFFDPNFGGAIVNGRRNVLTTTEELTGIAFLTEARRWSPLISRLRVHPTGAADVQWNLDYDQRKGRINASTVIADWHINEYFFGGGHAYLREPGEILVSPASVAPGPDRFSQYRLQAGYGHPNKRGVSLAGNIGFDANLNFLQYSNAQVAYNWDCMGLSVEYRRLALGSVRNENQFRFSLSLANIGTFGNLRRQERLF